jgi:hypothetical protein
MLNSQANQEDVIMKQEVVSESVAAAKKSEADTIAEIEKKNKELL